jgi:hypothetical protein
LFVLITEVNCSGNEEKAQERTGNDTERDG